MHPGVRQAAEGFISESATLSLLALSLVQLFALLLVHQSSQHMPAEQGLQTLPSLHPFRR